jgi:hypothetical protein
VEEDPEKLVKRDLHPKRVAEKLIERPTESIADNIFTMISQH